ncbi:hypothetical protein [Methylobacterium sp. Leaf87]|uniref:hypothetical protein n=1 Tax=Methylobacterium sp. Leaf87 TaxID=1736243 RepID=UPI0012E6F5FC|nr:hypothetical protein [Methylobacterium sp. Leaf87]
MLDRNLSDVAEVEIVPTLIPEEEAPSPDNAPAPPSSQAADLFAVVSQWLKHTIALGIVVGGAYCTAFAVARHVGSPQRFSDAVLYLGIILAAGYHGNIIALRSPCDPPLLIKALLGLGLASVAGGLASLFLAIWFPEEAVSIRDPSTASEIGLFLCMTLMVLVCTYTLRTCIIARRYSWIEAIQHKRGIVYATVAMILLTLTVAHLNGASHA